MSLWTADGKEFVINENTKEEDFDLSEIESKIVKILEEKIRPAVARDGGDIKFKEFKDGIVKVQLQGSCSGCPSSTMTLKQGVQNLLKHYIKEVKEVEAVEWKIWSLLISTIKKKQLKQFTCWVVELQILLAELYYLVFLYYYFFILLP